MGQFRSRGFFGRTEGRISFEDGSLMMLEGKPAERKHIGGKVTGGTTLERPVHQQLCRKAKKLDSIFSSLSYVV